MTDNGKPTRDERVERAEAESREASTEVLVSASGTAGGSYAYHDMRTAGRPLCGAGDEETEYVTVTIEEAQRRNKAPCQRCRYLDSITERD
ncbi:hypothetical protein [Haloplanus natans]|uniref:hypothetical protein n=1 Tax=Haloplanus natans TaxID=376171 RepID=UPI0006780321|nr:hypothetical protein [Haloplanus natans]